MGHRHCRESRQGNSGIKSKNSPGSLTGLFCSGLAVYMGLTMFSKGWCKVFARRSSERQLGHTSTEGEV